MKSALTYITFTKLKNQLKELFKKPAKLIYVIFFLALIVFTVFSGNTAQAETGEVFRDMRELIAGVLAFYTAMFILLVNNGFNNGSSMFTMPDVNFLFTGPFRPQRILFYGLLKQLGTSLLLGFFLLFQYSWLHNLYGITFAHLLYILIGYALTIFFAQFIAMLIYSFTSANPAKRKIWKICFYIIMAAFMISIALQGMQNGSFALQPIVEAATSTLAFLFPVVGWLTCIVFGLFTGNLISVVLGSILCAILLIALVCIIVFSHADYYEDVLKTTEIAQSAITAKKEGQMTEMVPQNVKVGKTGFQKGVGANTFYYKHVIENRRSRLLILSPMALIFAVVTIFFALLIGNDLGIYGIFGFSVYMQIFSIATGRFNLELLKPYIYLVPEPPFQKLFYSLKESIPSFLLQAIIIFVPLAFIMHLEPIDVIFCIIAHTTFSFLFLTSNILEERLFGGSGSKFIMIFFYIVALLVLSAPGIILAVVLSVAQIVIITPTVTSFLTISICNLLLSALVLFLCRNILQYAELNNK